MTGERHHHEYPSYHNSPNDDTPVQANAYKAYEKVYDKIPHVSSGRPKDGAQHAKAVELNDANQRSVRKRKEVCATAVVILTSIAALLLCARVLVVSPFQQENKSGTKLGDGREKRVDLFDEYGRYVLEDYDAKPAFSNFLPGVAGIYGKPVWSFYVNRGQGIASFGVKSKDFPILEFNSADKAYQNTALLGFRTFLQGSRGSRKILTEPFSPLFTNFESSNNDDVTGFSAKVDRLPKRFMYIGANEVQVREIDWINKIETNISFFVLPEEDFGALVKRTTITNIDTQTVLKISVLDGLARIEPAGGVMNKKLKNIGRTLEGWMGVYQPYNDSLGMPFYRLSTEASDTEAVKVERAGHYCLSVLEDDDQPLLLPIIFDTSKVFGEDTMMLRPVELETYSVDEILARPQYGFAKTSSAFAALKEIEIRPGMSITISSFYGKANRILDVPVIARRVEQVGFSLYKFTRARELVKQITASVETNTGSQLFNGHVQQMYLDNSLRGGIPIILGEVDDDVSTSIADEDPRLKVAHLFSRIHGDLERDYNNFEIDPTYFSQGPGNFRDVIQNRRCDVFFNPRIGAFDVKNFLSFIQADGYEPLTVEANVYVIKEEVSCQLVAANAVGHAEGHRAQRELLANILCSGAFRPGKLFQLMEEHNIELIMSSADFVRDVTAAATEFSMAKYETGYWADHWTYYMELIEAYVSVFPDKEQDLMYDQKLPYFFSPAHVQPRSQKYVLAVSFDGKKHVRQLEATVKSKTKESVRSMYASNSTDMISTEANWQHVEDGSLFRSSPIAKLLLLGTLKFATRDALGMGIEYEGGHPGWNDAMNGLCSMLGSGMPETFELTILLEYVKSVLSKFWRPIIVPRELATLISNINTALDKLNGYVYKHPIGNKQVPDEMFRYWDEVSSAREAYREETKLSFSGETVLLEAPPLLSILRRWLIELELGKQRAIAIGTYGQGDDGHSGITPTYFSFHVKKWRETGETTYDGHSLVIAEQLDFGTFPLFLEGPVRLMKSVNKTEAERIYLSVRNSPLHDKDLGMYTVSASLQGQSLDMGRMMAFTPGWLENQSVWMHMSYKFYLGIIRNGLFDIFFDEMRNGGMLPFMNADRYGRSLMECSSFIVSSAFQDPSTRGRGFLARLSGSTAEYLSMWVLMMIGPTPFFLDDVTGELRMQLLPALPLWLFERDPVVVGAPLTISFKLFTAINVEYHNVRRTNVFGVPPTRYEIGLRDGEVHQIHGRSIPQSLADKARRVGFVDYIHVYFE